MRNLFVKQYVEERELSVVLMIDMSGSTEFGGGGRRKRDLILGELHDSLSQPGEDAQRPRERLPLHGPGRALSSTPEGKEVRAQGPR